MSKNVPQKYSSTAYQTAAKLELELSDNTNVKSNFRVRLIQNDTAGVFVMDS